jgi:hypothetical protein
MDWIFFLQVVTAVMLANGLSVLFFYICWRVTKEERRTGTHETLSGWIYLAALVPLAFAFGGFYFMPH